MSTAWPARPLGKICDIQIGKTPTRSERRFWGGGNPWLSIKDMNQGRELWETAEGITDVAVEEQNCRLVEPGTVLLSFKLSIGKVGIAQRPMYTNEAIAQLPLTAADVDRDYLYWALRTVPLTGDADRAAMGATLNKAKLKRIPIPVPPIEEQRWIAAVLGAADALRAKRRAALAKLDTLTQAIFIDMFGDPFDRLTPTQPLSELATIVMGQSPPGDSYNAAGHGTPLLNGPTEFGAKYPQAVQWTTSPTRLSEPGDILFCVRGATAGRLNWSDGEYCLGRGLAAVRAPMTRRDYLFRVLHAYYPHFQSAGVGSTFINISKKELHALPVPQTDEATASVFAARVGALDTQKSLMESAAQSCADLFATLQHRAFRGEL